MRVAEKVNDVWRFLVYDLGGQMIAEYGGDNSSDSGSVKYLMSDWQGSTRAVVNATGFIAARSDYTAYGEDIGAGTGLRASVQGFGSISSPRQKYGSTERDDATGLDSTWFRKHENRAGRWTSPDPYSGSMSISNPQSFNRFSYVSGDPVNFIDPSGLLLRCHYEYRVPYTCSGGEGGECGFDIAHAGWVTICEDIGGGGGGGIFDGGGGGGISVPKRANTMPSSPQIHEQGKYDNCIKQAWAQFREEYFQDGFQAAAGTVIIAGATAFAIWEFGHGRVAKTIAGVFLPIHGAASVSLPALLVGGKLLNNALFTRNNAADRDKRLDECSKKFPNAKH